MNTVKAILTLKGAEREVTSMNSFTVLAAEVVSRSVSTWNMESSSERVTAINTGIMSHVSEYEVITTSSIPIHRVLRVFSPCLWKTRSLIYKLPHIEYTEKREWGWSLSRVPRNIKPPNPLKVLKSAEGNIVLVKTKGGYEYIGVLDLADGVMNVVLSNCVEYNEGKPTLRLGKVIIRGSNIEFVSVDYGRVSPESIQVKL